MHRSGWIAPLLAGSCLALGICASAVGTTLNTDFVPPPAGTHFYGNAGVVNSEQMLKLNPSGAVYSDGAVQFPTQDPGQKIGSFDLTYDQYMGGGPAIADAAGQLTGSWGMAVSYGTSLPTGAPANAEDGVGSGLIVSFNTFWNAGDSFGDGIQVSYDGKVVVQKVTGDSFLRTSGFVPVEIDVNNNGQCTVDYNGKTICSDVPLPSWGPMTNPCLEFSGGGSDCSGDEHCIKQMCMKQNNTPEPATAGMMAALGGMLLRRRRRAA